MGTKTKGRAAGTDATSKTTDSPNHKRPTNKTLNGAPLRLLINIPEWRFETEAMTTAECGALLKLKMHFWRNGTLPDRDQALAQIAGLSPAAWKKARKALEPRFIVMNGEWQRTDWSDELAEAYEAVNRARAFSKQGNDARWGKKKHPVGSPVGNPKRNPKETLRSKAPSQGLNSSNCNTFEADVRAAEIDLGLLLAGRSS